MRENDLARISERLGAENALWLIANFPNKRLPGLRFINRKRKTDFLVKHRQAEFLGWTVAAIAQEYHVTTRTVLNWMKEERQKRKSKSSSFNEQTGFNCRIAGKKERARAGLHA